MEGALHLPNFLFLISYFLFTKLPAVNLLQLRVELNDLLWNFTDPPAFRNTLLDLLEKFAYTAYRSESKARAVSTRPQLQVSLILLREMDLVLIPAIREQPQAALAICDLLWNDENMDVCLIASRMLGEIPIEHADLVLDRAGEWALAGVRHMTARTLLKNASALIMRHDPEILLRKVRRWYVDPREEQNYLCLEGMAILVEDRSFENLPAIFTLLEALMGEATMETQNALTELFLVLYERTPNETVYVIRQCLNDNPNVTAQRVIRRVIPTFDPKVQKSLQDALREAARNVKRKK
ncbi:MAG: hypothetical protein IJI57_02695 [Flexilinea sp.]|nr:hypothetical protein [Flexilinea sp.]